MAAFRRLLGLVFVCLASLSAAQIADQVVAARVLGPYWREISRSAGMVFSGTVLGVERQPAGKSGPMPLMLIKFRVDRGIAGVQSGQVLTVREWAGAWSMHRAMRSGQRVLIFLYPPSRLGLTSPVGGALGQVALDSRGEIVAPDLPESSSSTSELTAAAEAGADFRGVTARLKPRPFKAQTKPGSSQQVVKRCSTQSPIPGENCPAANQSGLTIGQVERAVRNARKNSSAAPVRTKE